MLRKVSVLLLCVTVAGSVLYLSNQPVKETEQVSYQPRDKEQRFEEIENSSGVPETEETFLSQSGTFDATNSATFYDQEVFQNTHNSLMQIIDAYDANLTDLRERQLLEQKFAEQSDAYKQQVLSLVRSQN